MELTDVCCFYVSFLRALYLIHQNNHWLSKGKNFYGNHLLFERIYQSAAENADLAAEKFIGIFSEDCVNLQEQNKCIAGIIEKFGDGKDPIKTSLEAEKKFLEFSKSFYDGLKEADKLTLGLDDCIMQIASKREEAVYLLQQTEKDMKKSSITIVKEKFMAKLAQASKLNLGQIETALKAMLASANPGAFSVRVKQEGNQIIGTLFLETQPGSQMFKLDKAHQEGLLATMRKTINDQLVKQLGQMPQEFAVNIKLLPLSDISKMAQAPDPYAAVRNKIDEEHQLQWGQWGKPAIPPPPAANQEQTMTMPAEQIHAMPPQSYPAISTEIQDQLNQIFMGKMMLLKLDGKLGPETAKALKLFKDTYHKPATASAIKEVYLAMHNPGLETKFPEEPKTPADLEKAVKYYQQLPQTPLAINKK